MKTNLFPTRISTRAIFFLSMLSAVCYFILGYFVSRDNFPLLITFYMLPFAATYFTYRLVDEKKQVLWLLEAGIFFRAILLFSIPAFSDDYFRFLWDGQLSSNWINPFASLPQEIADGEQYSLSPEMYQLVTDKNYYSVYPPICQFIFHIASQVFPGSISSSILVMKVFILLFEGGSIYFMYRLAERLRVSIKVCLLYALNPLVIIELSGNLHFEAAMIFFTLLAVWALWEKNRFALSAIAFGAAIASKLLPVLLLIFFFKRLGFLRTLHYSAIAIATVFTLYLPFDIFNIYENIFSSARLYFQSFEFNGSIYYIIRWIGSKIEGYNVIQTVGLYLSLATTASILIYAFFENTFTKRLLFNALLFSLTIYYFMATTVHPWYLTPLIAFSVFTNYRFIILWSGLILFTYCSYSGGNYHERIWVVAIEYVLVYLYLAGEIFNKSNWGIRFRDWHIRERAKIKVNRIKRYFKAGESVLDIGSGNGGVCKLLRERGVETTSIDIKNRSFYKDIQPLVYDGETLPFADNKFDKVTILTVLHHCKNPEQVLGEAVRVAGKEIIIIEDVYKSVFQKYLTFFMDSIVNNHIWAHPHTNKTSKQWEATFSKLGLAIIEKKEHRILLFFRQVTFRLAKASSHNTSKDK